jgi:hypothetical protein
MVEQVLQTHGRLCALLFLAEHLQNRRIEPRRAWKVVASRAEEQRFELSERLVAALTQYGDEQPHELPPLTQLRPGQVFELFGNL